MERELAETLTRIRRDTRGRELTSAPGLRRWPTSPSRAPCGSRSTASTWPRPQRRQLYAIDDTCTHAEVSLSEGEVDDGEIECWLHGSRFDLASGHPTGLPATQPIAVYPVKIDGDDVLVDVEHPLNATDLDGSHR